MRIFNGILVPVRTSFGVAVKCRVYQRKVDVNMLNAVKSMLADVSSVSPSSEQRVVRRLSDLWKYHSILYRKLPGTQGLSTVTIVFNPLFSHFVF